VNAQTATSVEKTGDETNEVETDRKKTLENRNNFEDARTLDASNTTPLITSEQSQTGKQDKNNGCIKAAPSEIWVDKLRAGTHTRLCNTAGWLDGLFGDEEDFKGEDFRGKISLGFRHDEIEGIDPRLRVRIRTKLPNVSKRLNAFVGRVEEDSYISNTEVNQVMWDCAPPMTMTANG